MKIRMISSVSLYNKNVSTNVSSDNDKKEILSYRLNNITNKLISRITKNIEKFDLKHNSGNGIVVNFNIKSTKNINLLEVNIECENSLNILGIKKYLVDSITQRWYDNNYNILINSLVEI